MLHYSLSDDRDKLNLNDHVYSHKRQNTVKERNNKKQTIIT